MKKLVLLIGVCLALAPTILPAADNVLHGNIPFDFWVGDKLAPAGSYVIQTSDGKTVFRQEGGRLVAAWMLGIPESRIAPPEKGELVFHRYGDEYFFSTVWTPNSKLGYKIPMTSREKTVARGGEAAPQLASVPAN
jgi:hypothetical protein